MAMRSATPGSVRRTKAGTWHVRVECGRNPDGTRRVVTGTYPTRAEAERVRMETVEAMRTRARFGSRTTLAEYWAERFEPSRAAYLTNSTINQYRAYWRRYAGPRLGSMPIADIRFSDVQASMAGMSRSCAKHYASTVRAILGAAWEDDVIDANPLLGRRLRFPGADAGPLPVWGAEEVAAALPLLRGTPFYRLWLVMVGSGARREEAFALRERDIGYDRVLQMTPAGGREAMVAHARISEAVTLEDGRKAPKNARSVRTVEIAEPFAGELWETRPEDPDAPICALSLSNLPKRWHALWEESGFGPDVDPKFYKGRLLRAGLPFVTLSRMRATHETLMQSVGVTDTLNAAIHGRTNVQTGYRHYLAPRSDAQLAAAQAVGDRVRDAM